jgi:hypothetical protein
MGLNQNANIGEDVSKLGVSNITLAPGSIAAAENYTKTGGTGDQNQAWAQASQGIKAIYDDKNNLTGFKDQNGNSWDSNGNLVSLASLNYNAYTVDPNTHQITGKTSQPHPSGGGFLGDLGGLAPVLGIGALLLAPELAPELFGSLGGAEAVGASTLLPGTVLANGATVLADGSIIAADGSMIAGAGSAAVSGGAAAAGAAGATEAAGAAAPAAATDTTAAATAAPATTPATSFDSFGNPVAAGSPAATMADPTGLAQAQLSANAAAATAAGAAGAGGITASQALQGASLASKLLNGLTSSCGAKTAATVAAGLAGLAGTPKTQARGLQSATQCFGPQPTFKWNINQPAAVSNGVAYGQQMLTPDYSPAAAPSTIAPVTPAIPDTTGSIQKCYAEGGLASLHTSHVGNLLHAVQSQGFPLDHHTLAKIKHLKSIGAPDHHVIGFLHHEKRLAGGGALGHYSDGGQFLKGPGDGMSDDIPANIAGKQEARLANEEFVIPADVVSHLGNGSSEAGAKVLYKMMHQVRKDRTGNPEQGKQIDPDKYMPA